MVRQECVPAPVLWCLECVFAFAQGKRVGLMLCPAPTRLHDVLMELQKRQLQQLSAWLTLTEERIQKMETCPLDDDLKSLQKLLEDHKVNLAHISFIPF